MPKMIQNRSARLHSLSVGSGEKARDIKIWPNDVATVSDEEFAQLSECAGFKALSDDSVRDSELRVIDAPAKAEKAKKGE